MRAAKHEADEARAARQTLELKIANLEKDKAKAMQLSMKAIAARSNIKEYLDEEKAKSDALHNQILHMQDKVKEAEEERVDMEHKHNEMFNSVSALNARIEELETHKLHLIQKLKSHGDKGGLDYIIKTQKLDQMDSQAFINRVEVENYDP